MVQWYGLEHSTSLSERACEQDLRWISYIYSQDRAEDHVSFNFFGLQTLEALSGLRHEFLRGFAQIWMTSLTK